MAGVALGDISTFLLRNRRGTYGTGLALVTRLVPVGRPWLAGMALGDIHCRLTWQAWYSATSSFVLRGRCGTYDTWLGLVTRLVPVGRPWRRGTFAWQVWHLVTW